MNGPPDNGTPDDAGEPPSPAPRNRGARLVVSTFGVVTRPLQAFLRLEAASGIVLLAAAVVALVWANSPASETYRTLFERPVTLAWGDVSARFDLRSLINDGLMALFFFLVGMEIKRELVVGELSSVKKAMLPAIAALGGMLVPSAIFLLFTWGTPAQRGWGVPMATDIAFSIGCLALLGKRIPHALVVFLTALAVFDDIGGILVIAAFYGHGLHAGWLLTAAALTVVLAAMNRAYVRNGVAYLLVGAGLWYSLHHGGIHATIAGVILGLCIPARPARPGRQVLEELHTYTRDLVATPGDEDLDAASILQIEEKLEDLESPLQRFVHLLHPWVAFAIMPLFALANAGVSLAQMELSDLGQGVTLGIMLGLLLGKPIGIFVASFLAVKLGAASLPVRVAWPHVLGVGVIAGIGFTVALFIGALAFADHPALLDRAKVGILLGSLLSGVVGFALLRLTAARPASQH